MPPSKRRTPRRLIVCVDGTWFTPDGSNPTNLSRNQTNVYRLYASVKKGNCKQEDGTWIEQEPVYFTGLGSRVTNETMELTLLKHWTAGIFGEGFSKQIKDVYEKCCQLTEEDEVWLYGFSRGAFVVRAVAGLLYHIRILKARGNQFDTDFKEALRQYSHIRQFYRERGTIYHFVKEKTAPAPTVRFVGVFDTVKALRDEGLYDIEYNDGIQHLRHALALHENRAVMAPEAIYPMFGDQTGETQSREDHSMIQAWFVGTHSDIGGSRHKDGLSLYPFQWMLSESVSKGLHIGFEKVNIPVDNPLELAYPTDGAGAHEFKLPNGIRVTMHDLQPLHKGSHDLKLHYNRSVLWPKKAREPFASDGSLKGYIGEPELAQGTIIHPSVYFLLFHYGYSLMPVRDTQERKMRERLIENERKMLGTKDLLEVDHAFWNSPPFFNDEAELDKTWPLRILVCGNSGVGKSTLINQVFGVEVTKSQARERGDHDIWHEITWKDRPDLVVHDSSGFEAAKEWEMEQIVEFLQKKGASTDINECLHVIWFCLYTPTNRPKQQSTISLMQAICEHAPDVPLVVVATQKDLFLAQEFATAFAKLKAEGRKVDMQLDEDSRKDAAVKLDERVALIEEEMREVLSPKGNSQLHACVAVSEGDAESIRYLTEQTIECIHRDDIRLRYISAQVVSLDAKVQAAIVRVMQEYKKLVKRSSLTAGVPLGPTITKSTAYLRCCKTVLSCFGLPMISVKTAWELVIAHVWVEMGPNFAILLAEAINTLGLFPMIFSADLSPAFLKSRIGSPALVVPVVGRMYLIVSADLILILTRCLEEARHRRTGPPSRNDLTNHAQQYRKTGMANSVHKRLEGLIPIISKPENALKHDYLHLNFKRIIEEYKKEIISALDPNAPQLSDAQQLNDSNNTSEADSVKDTSKVDVLLGEELEKAVRDIHLPTDLSIAKDML